MNNLSPTLPPILVEKVKSGETWRKVIGSQIVSIDADPLIFEQPANVAQW